jgi:hypothetical protein
LDKNIFATDVPSLGETQFLENVEVTEFVPKLNCVET